MTGATTQQATATSPATPSHRPRIPLRSAGIVLPLGILFVILSVSSSHFLTVTNLLNILDQQSAVLIIAAAGTLVMVSGGLDLSVGSIYALAGVVAAQIALTHSWPVALVAGLVVGLLVGIVNGVVTTYFRINSLISTLAMSFIVAGVATQVTHGNLITLAHRPAFANLARSRILGITTSTWLMVLVVAGLGVVLSRTVTGRHIYASGGNAEAASLAGIRVASVQISAFALSGMAAALGGVIDASRVLSAQSSAGGSALAFTVLAGIVVGGTSILGGEGTVVGTVMGVLFIALVGNGFDLLRVDPLYQQVSLGVILLLAVGLDSWSRGRRT